MSARRVDVLVFDGCPNVDLTVARVREAIALTGRDATVRVVHVETEARAKELAFLGSPSVRVDDVDVEEAAQSRNGYGLQCRLYDAGGRLEGAPPAAWIAAALQGKRSAEATSSRSPSAQTDAPDCCARKQ
jgi:hypothetical protein